MWDSGFAGMKRGLCPDTQNQNEDHFVDVRDYRGSGASGCSSPGRPLQPGLHFCLNLLFQFASNLSHFFLTSLSVCCRTQRCLPSLYDGEMTSAIVQLHRPGERVARLLGKPVQGSVILRMLFGEM